MKSTKTKMVIKTNLKHKGRINTPYLHEIETLNATENLMRHRTTRKVRVQCRHLSKQHRPFQI